MLHQALQLEHDQKCQKTLPIISCNCQKINSRLIRPETTLEIRKNTIFQTICKFQWTIFQIIGKKQACNLQASQKLWKQQKEDLVVLLATDLSRTFLNTETVWYFQNRLKTRFFKIHIGKDQLICINMQVQSTRKTGIIYVPEQSRAFINVLTILGSAEILWSFLLALEGIAQTYLSSSELPDAEHKIWELLYWQVAEI